VLLKLEKMFIVEFAKVQEQWYLVSMALINVLVNGYAGQTPGPLLGVNSRFPDMADMILRTSRISPANF